jgi:8-oxo-dGTP pyrophosphatase MutT (NUDIX family)
MDKYNLIEMLRNYVPSRPEISFKDRMTSFIDEYDDCFERFLEIGHITASSWLLSKDHNKALLMHHTKLDQWFQLGGHCDGNPDVVAVAIKEAQEESGIQHIMPVMNEIFDIDIHLIPEKKHEKEHYHYDVRFLLQVVRDELIAQNKESKELRWIGKDPKELPTNNPSVVRMFNKWITKK